MAGPHVTLMPGTPEGQHLRLRPFTPADSVFLHALDNDATVMRFINGGIPIDEQSHRDTVLPAFTAAYEHPYGFWMAELDGQLVGWFSLRPTSERVAELGYRLARIAWGQGVATQGAKQLVDMAIRAGVSELIANVYEHNVASVRVLEKLGFQQTRRYRWQPENASDTATQEGMTVWDGEDLEYRLTSQLWRSTS